MRRPRILGVVLSLLLGLTVLPSFAAEPAPVAQGARPEGAVSVMAADGLILEPANYFDLQGKTLRFTPTKTGGYTLKVLPLAAVAPTGTKLEPARSVAPWPILGWSVDLPFRFPFGGANWDKVYVNYLGNLSFGAPENASWPARNAWPDGTIRSIAANMDARSAAGLEHVIAVLWNYYDEDDHGTIHVQTEAQSVTITWQVRRMGGRTGLAERPELNQFQARLYPDGSIDLSYPSVKDRDGVVGLFPGQMGATGQVLDHADDPLDASDPSVEIRSVDVYDRGSIIAFTFTMAADLPKQVTQGELMHRFLLTLNGRECGVYTALKSQRSTNSDCGFVPGVEVDGRRVTLLVPRSDLAGSGALKWRADVIWWGIDGRFDQVAYNQPRSLSIKPLKRDLSSLSGETVGNLYEAFHYPAFSKDLTVVMPAIYKRFKPDDDLALVFTDFRYDALNASASATGRINVPIQGIGEPFAKPQSGAAFGSTQLQSAVRPVYVGAPFLAETYVGEGHTARNYGRGLDWIAHELVHSWSAALKFRNPVSGKVEPLYADQPCTCHWRPELHLPAFVSVIDQYSSGYKDHSLMWSNGGNYWQENPDGTFTAMEKPYHFPTGLAALDLYVMGLLPANQVPDTFMLANIVPLGNGRVRATKVPVRISDIISAMGPRQPSADQAQRRFTLGVYLLHEPGRQPDPAMLKRTKELSAAIAKHFNLITGGRMEIVY